MERIPDKLPNIAPLPRANRPLWSVMIPTFNSSSFLTESLESVLSQALSADDMQIQVVDDASTDADVAALIAQIGGGRVLYYRQPKNVGNIENFNTCLARAHGQLVHILHGDDAVQPGFYKKMGELMRSNPDAGAAFCRFDYIDERGKLLYTQPPEATVDGILDEWLERIAIRNRIQYAAMVVRRDVYRAVGDFRQPGYGEDWDMWARIAHQYPIAYTPHTLASYRKHGNTISANKFLTGSFIDDLQATMDRIATLLPDAKKSSIRTASEKFYAAYALRQAGNIWAGIGDKNAVATIIKKTLGLQHSWQSRVHILKLQAKMLLNIR